ncbi:aminoacyl-tRNA deacylase [Leekyejoonella antrihumi]|uniref:Cys-tRNA(Pro)/Cys-tRNA(Cys) deacylase n=1 Tax=Leekyejoonella antrihumi TaxID=1660198 RepID=A0A563E2V5_9MICO|nr:aminoacyl-tRNA deacylase [Leekyejoonella antrihumi]TWP36856.1 aminoacyl-tRNA deacylase [Leekyejoonella antrihumi]
MSPARSRHHRAASGSTPATVALTSAGVDFVERPYPHEGGVTAYGDEAADALDEPADHIFKTLVTAEALGPRPRLIVAVVPVPRRLDLKALAHRVGVKKLVMAQQAAAERATGYLVGAISPFGQKQQLPIVLDDRALALPHLLVSGGRRGLDLQLSPTDLIELTGATTGPISR